jgi:hypothetical protein
MKWIEVIDLRATMGIKKVLKEVLLKPLRENERNSGLKKIIFYHNAYVETDVSIQLQWEPEEGNPEKSNLGLHLASALEEFGRVNHSIWIEDEGGIK